MVGRRLSVFAGPTLLVAGVILQTTSVRVGAPTEIYGTVRDAVGPVGGAVVRVQTTSRVAITDRRGRFVLRGLDAGRQVVLTAWAPGYYIAGGTPCTPAIDRPRLTLIALPSSDSSTYAWVSAYASGDAAGNCQHCHSDPADLDPRLPFDEWTRDAHAHSTTNPRFISMYAGTDVQGRRSPRTRYVSGRDYGPIPRRPDPNESYYGPGYKRDFPVTAGNCAACHAPAASLDAAYRTDPRAALGVGTEGVACDFCHKIVNVRLDPATGHPYRNMPGVLSFEFRRPPKGRQLFAGPFDDVAPGDDMYSPLYRASQYCAPCHVGVFWDTTVYNSFGEWLASPYARDGTGKTCQDCHMPAGRTDHFVRLDKGGRTRDPASIASHRMPGANDPELLKSAASVSATTEWRGGVVIVRVSVTNDGTGHHVPTDSPLRHLILLVRARDAAGEALSLVEGPALPPWIGVGDPESGHYAGLPGKAFAKILMELWTEISPTGAYWNPTRVISDNRLAAYATDVSEFRFATPPAGDVSVDVELMFRRAFLPLQRQKGWNLPDIVMQTRHMIVRRTG